jgi:hypothetical protein
MEETTMIREPLPVYLGHHKCATAWINSIIVQVCRDMNLKFAHVHNPGMFNQKLDLFVAQNRLDFLAYTNADIRFVAGLDNFLAFHVIRDPRDIVVSAYFSHLYSHPTEGWPALIEHRAKLQKVSKEEGLILEMQFSRKEFEDLYNWNYSQPHILEIKMEDLIESPYETMVDAFSFLRIVSSRYSLKTTATFLCAAAMNRIRERTRGLFPFSMTMRKVPVENLLGYIYDNRFSKKADGRNAGQEDMTSHFRKGIAGDWVNHFNSEHCTYFKKNETFELIQHTSHFRV